MENVNKRNTCKQIICTRRQIFLALNTRRSSKFDKQVEVLEKNFTKSEGCPFAISTDERKSLRNLLFAMKKKWQDSRKNLKHFYAVNEEWLDKDVTITNADFKKIDVPTTNSDKSGFAKSHKLGRPSLDFSSSSERSKRRKVNDLRKSTCPMALALATEMNLRASGSHAAAKMLKDIRTASPKRASRNQLALAQVCKPVRQEISADAALNLIISGKMTKETYNMVRELTNENSNVSVYPGYHKILAAKSRCYPPECSIYITETSAEVSLQALLDHTTARLVQLQSDVIKTLDSSLTNNVKLILTWGCDGSSSQKYKQKFDESDSSVANVFFTTVVPLQMLASDEKSEPQLVIWENPSPSSPRYCRPLRLQIFKETVQSTVDEKNIVDKQIASLVTFNTVTKGTNVEVKYELSFMNYQNMKSAQRCYLSNLMSKNFNNLTQKKMSDVFYQLLASSDPLITNFQKLKINKSASLSSNVVEVLLATPEGNVTNSGSSLAETDTCTTDPSDPDYDF